MLRRIKGFVRAVCKRCGLFIECVKIQRYEVERSNALEGKRIMITGGSSGIGLAIAKKSVASGAIVLITGRNEDRLIKARHEDSTGRLLTMAWDVTSREDFRYNIDEAIRLLGGRLDILVNNAGISIREEFGNLSLSVWDSLVETNLTAPIFATQYVTNIWRRENQEGVVLFVSSMAGEEPAIDAYAASKCALSSMAKGIGRSLAPYGIRVNAIAPGVVIGTGLREIQRSIQPDGDIKCQWIPARRYAVPDEIAEVAVFMMSDRASYMNGTVIVCDGAGSLRR